MIWHALSGPQHHFAQGNELARRFPIDFGPFCAVPDDAGVEHFAALSELVEPATWRPSSVAR